jgi:hypothetical protein
LPAPGGPEIHSAGRSRAASSAVNNRNIHGKMMEEKDFPELLQSNLIANKGLR